MEIIDRNGLVPVPLNHRVTSSCLFRSLSPAQASELRREMRFTAYEPGEPMFLEGEEHDRVHLICSGRVKLSRTVEEQSHYLRALVGAGDFAGLPLHLDSGPRDMNAIPATEVMAASISCEELRSWCLWVPAIGLDLARERHARAREFELRALHLALHDTAARLARLLIALAERFGATVDGVLRVEHQLTQEELAQLIGCSRETACKSIQHFVTRGWIRVTDDGVHVLQPLQLLRRAR
ncbi:Crp/Fnr family transcriptional regulator [Crossiella sp. CA-258035]|uniref:Crp/Fnr family transcriptional regulator n=1 Tax=Crossiella sp. CA-258035 TaxID=2981138 RepID=UPI0024BCC7B5|nr:Crp/Fnr family transcriptional regulator [Crossiella sp. CA-258035]WHT23402.1 Crp/Fnr family transcriptional regulator [Crossiella sp. CA-258035]